ITSIKVIRNKQTGQSEGYGFAEFVSHTDAENVLNNYSGTAMLNTDQPFKLNWASFSMGDRRTDMGSDRSIFVGDLASDVTDTLLQETFASKYPSVKGAKVVMDANTGRSKGYGFVRFGDDTERSRAMTEMNGAYCSSRPMRIGLATPRKSAGYQQGGYASNGTSAQGLQSDGDSTNTTIFVGGLDASVTEEDLRQTFSQNGEIVNVKIPVGKGCGFVQFSNRSSAEEALQKLNGTLIGKQTVRLSWGRNPANNKQVRRSLNWSRIDDYKFRASEPPSPWNGGYYGQAYEGYGYAAALPQDQSMYAAAAPYGAYSLYGNNQQVSYYDRYPLNYKRYNKVIMDLHNGYVTSLFDPMLISVEPTYQEIDELEAKVAELDFFKLCLYHYVLLTEVERMDCLMILAYETVEDEDIIAVRGNCGGCAEVINIFCKIFCCLIHLIMVRTRSQIAAYVQAKFEELKTRYFGQQSLADPTSIPVEPTYEGMSEEAMDFAEDDFFWLCRFHYDILTKEEQLDNLRCLAKETVESSMRTKSFSPRSKFVVSSSLEEALSSGMEGDCGNMEEVVDCREVVMGVVECVPIQIVDIAVDDAEMEAEEDELKYFGDKVYCQVPSLDLWKLERGIPDDVEISYYNESEELDPKYGFLCYLNQLVYGLRVLMNHFQKGAMNILHCCPAQLNGNVYEMRRVYESLKKRWRENVTARQFVVVDVMKFYKRKYLKASRSCYLYSDSSRPKYFNFNSAGRPWNDHLVLVRGNYLQVPDEPALELEFKYFNMTITTLDHSSLFDQVAREQKDLK
ncbi:hypothetical protein GIB67_003059, partial [Kingdonia uniflora]